MLSQPFVKKAFPQEDYTILLVFEDGERARFRLKPYLNTPLFASLRDRDHFHNVRVEQGSLVWPHGETLAYDMLHMLAEPMTSPFEGRRRRQVDLSMLAPPSHPIPARV